jgi:sugar phosphate isomerase/epimerase
MGGGGTSVADTETLVAAADIGGVTPTPNPPTRDRFRKVPVHRDGCSGGSIIDSPRPPQPRPAQVFRMTLSTLPLSYCTNVHPGQSVAEVISGLDAATLPIRREFGRPLAAGLWLARAVMDELPTADARRRFGDELRQRDLGCYTLNTFPYGNFHGERVKEQVYLPDWTTVERERYTLECAVLLAELLPDDVDGSLSTVPLGFKRLATAPGFLEDCLGRLISVARQLARLRETTGKLVRLAIEPEPLCVLETTAETIAFFRQLRERAVDHGDLEAVETHLGVCYDVCHQAVEFEDAPTAIAALSRAGIRINKVHLSCAIEAVDVGGDDAVRQALARYVEPRYLHQTFARDPAGGILSYEDLDHQLLEHPSDAWRGADCWRVHFHVPLDARSLGPLGTTRPDLEAALPAVAALPYAPHLEVETYTWEVLPDGGRPQVVTGLARELRAAADLLESVSDG